jgi:cGMP-dependent protein kinase
METVKIQRSHTNLRLEQFICLKKLGEGQFGTVYLVKESKDSKNVYAVKCIKKRQVVEYKMEKIIL